MDALDKIREASGVYAGRETSMSALGLDSLELLQLFHELNVPATRGADLETVGDLVDCADPRAAG